MATYEDYGYGQTLVRETSQPVADGFMFPVDSQLMIGGIGAGQVRQGSLGSNMVLTGSITINDESGDEAIVFDGNGITIGRGMIKIDKNGLLMNDGKNDRVLIGYQKDGF